MNEFVELKFKVCWKITLKFDKHSISTDSVVLSKNILSVGGGGEDE